MVRYAFSHRWQLIALGLVSLLALVMLVYARAVAPATPAIQLRPAANEAGSAAVADPLQGLNPADRKFYNGWTIHSAGTGSKMLVPPNVDPADRKFYNQLPSLGTMVCSVPAWPADAHPADRKFYNGWYAP